MFSKLLKHEFKSQLGLFGLLSGIALGAGVLGFAVMTILRQVVVNSGLDLFSTTESTVPAMLISLAIPLGISLILGVAVYAAVIRILMLYRFYQHLFTDEGYLTFTLPVSTHQILLSSTLNMTIWSLISSVVAVVSVLLLGFSMVQMISALFGEDMSFIMKDIQQDMQMLRYIGFDDVFVLQGISMVATFLAGIVQPMVSLALGSVVAKKHKLLAGIGIYFGINMAVSTITSVVNGIALVGDGVIAEVTGTYAAMLTFLLPALLSLALAIGGYFLTHFLLDKKLNLP